MIARDTLTRALQTTLAETNFQGLGERYVGKVRDNYTKENTRLIVVTDRISAFDRVIGTLPFKGQLLNQMAAYWFEATHDIAPNHLLSVPDPQVTEALECVPLPVEMVMRAYVTGVTSTSIWTHYERGERVFCGHRLPDGLRKNERLPEPSTKAEKGGHDISASREEILAMGRITDEVFHKAEVMARKLFEFGQKRCADRGLILVDTKYEFGLMKNSQGLPGSIVIIDEIHTPDSSRFWFADSYAHRFEQGLEPASFDKEYVRRWLADHGFNGDGPVPEIPDEVRAEASLRYIEAYERITNRTFEPNVEDPQVRLARNLNRYRRST
jgi:phosphoribosylaminoimidazole-succinocarboxamide synthase